MERIREATNGNYALGDRRFQAEIEQALGRRVTKGKAGRLKAQPEHRRGQFGLLRNRGLSSITPITLTPITPITPITLTPITLYYLRIASHSTGRADVSE